METVARVRTLDIPDELASTNSRMRNIMMLSLILTLKI
jgi:hypothetical protein